MAEIIPAIIAKNFKELKDKIKKIEKHFQWVQLDIMDGKFVPNITWKEPKDLRKIKTPLKIEVHLMVENPSESVEEWLKNGAQRVVLHWESLGKKPEVKFLEIKEKVKKLKRELGIALNPETPWLEIEKLIPQLDLVLLMTVHPGFGGQQFLKESLVKIKSLRRTFPNLKIEIDGGINSQTGKECLKAGADILVSGSYIFEKLKNLSYGNLSYSPRKD